MLNESEELAILYGKYVSNEITKQEFERFQDLLLKYAHEDALTDLMDQTWKDTPPVPGDLIEALPAPAGEPERSAGKVRLLFRRYWPAAAAACLLIIAGITLFPGAAIKKSVLIPAKKQSLEPGGNKAMLRLDDGRQIVLDSTSNGGVAQQGGAQIVKLTDGQVAYKASGDNSGKVFYNTMETPKGGQYQLLLPDGSRVWLNSASSIRYPTAFTGPSRDVEVKGEAYFEVAKNQSQPFVIVSRGMKVEVLGTEFNLMAYEDEDAMRTTLVNGSVRVVKGVDSKIIQQGEQASLAAGEKKFTVSRPNMNEVLGWKEGEFRFKNANIKVIMRQIARWYDVDVEYDGKLPTALFSGFFPRKEFARQLLDALEATGDIRFIMKEKKIIVSSPHVKP